MEDDVKREDEKVAQKWFSGGLGINSAPPDSEQPAATAPGESSGNEWSKLRHALHTDEQPAEDAAKPARARNLRIALFSLSLVCLVAAIAFAATVVFAGPNGKILGQDLKETASSITKGLQGLFADDAGADAAETKELPESKRKSNRSAHRNQEAAGAPAPQISVAPAAQPFLIEVVDSNTKKVINVPERSIELRINPGNQPAVTTRIQPQAPASPSQGPAASTVLLAAEIGPDGMLHSLRPFSGPPELYGAAMEAASKWKYAAVAKGEEPPKKTVVTVYFHIAAK